MKILHRHILLSHLLNLGLTLFIFTFLLLVGNISRDLMALLSNPSVGYSVILRLFVLLIPSILSLTMPLALMASTLLLMGRFSADNELTACRACGVSLLEVTLPIFGVAAFLALLCLYINGFVAPNTKYLFNRVFVDVGLQNPLALLEEGKAIRDFPDMVLFIGRRDLGSKTLHDVRVMMLENNEVTQDIHAQKGVVSVDSEQMLLNITLLSARIDQRDPVQPDNPEKRKWGMTVAEYPLKLDMTRLINQRKAVRELNHLPSDELWKQALELKTKGIHPTPMLVELHKRAALALACVAFVLVALPLGIQAQRRETSIGILLSLALSVLWYFFVLFAETFKKNPHAWPELIVWAPNLFFQFVGLILFWKQNRV